MWAGSSWFLGVQTGQAYLTWIESIESYTEIAWTNQSGYGVGFESGDGWTFAIYTQKTGDMKFEELPIRKSKESVLRQAIVGNERQQPRSS